MASGPRGAVLSQIQRLFQVGSASGLSEWQLLRRYLALRDESAFETLVARHGPMVLGVCRRLLQDPRDVEDAFQATFLVLVRRASVLGERDAVGPWLYGVAYRVSLRARSVALKRRGRERQAEDAEIAAPAADAARFDLDGVLDQELGRLPAKYRAPVVLCYFEGLTHEEAAHRLGWPVGSVKGRLARARELLKARLTRRGLVLTGGMLLTSLSRGSRAAVSEALRDTTVRIAIRFAADQSAGVVPATVAALTQGMLRTMAMSKMSVAAVSVIITTGALVFASQGADRKSTDARATVPDTVTSDSQRRTPDLQARTAESERDEAERPRSLAQIAQERTSTAALCFKFAVAAYEDGAGPDLYALNSRRLAEAEYDSTDVKAKRISAIEAHLKRMRDLEKREQSKTRARDVGLNLNARAARLEAEWWLAKAEFEPDATREAAKTAVPPTVADSRKQDPDRRVDLAKKSLAIQAALENPVPANLVELKVFTLEQALKAIRIASRTADLPAGIPIYVDPSGLQETGQTFVSVISEGSGGSLKDLLLYGLRPLKLAYMVNDGMLHISSRDEIVAMETKLLRAEVKTLGDQVGRLSGPPATVSDQRGSRGGPMPSEGPRRSDVSQSATDQEEKVQTDAIVAALNKVISLHVKDAKLDDIVKLIKASSISRELPHGIPIYVEPYGIKQDEDMAKGAKATINLEGIRLKTSLRLLLNQLSLGYAVKEGLLIIASPNSQELQGGIRGMGGTMGGIGGGMR
jgi:RNA polymerase sigma factor (sigma-70 family)